MKTEVKKPFTPYPVLLKEAFESIIEKMGVGKALQFWLALEGGAGDYLKVRKRLFAGASVSQLAKGIKKFNK